MEIVENKIVKPWDGSGIEVVGTDASSVMEEAGLNWEVEGRPLFIPKGNPENMVEMTQVSTHKAIVRKTDEEQLGIVGSNWNILQNIDVFNFIDELVKLGLVKYSNAGSFKNGKVIYVMGEFAESEILPGDVHKSYLLFTNAFDGTFSVRIGWTDVRIACWNTFIMASEEVRKTGFSIRHTSMMKDKIEDAKTAIVAAESEMRKAEMFQKALTRLNMTDEMWNDFGTGLIPDPEAGKNAKRAQHARENLLSLTVNGRGQDISGVAGTGYAALNGLTEYVNYSRSSRGQDDDSRQSNRFQSTLFGSGGRMIDRGVDILNGFLLDQGIQVETVV